MSIQNHRQYYSSAYSNYYNSALSVFLIQILICYCHSQTPELCHVFKHFVNYLCHHFVLHSSEETATYT
jgi:hypothetical protein